MTQLKFRAYGNWCGPGFPKEGDPEPIDEIDLACKLHDKAYSSSSHWSEADRGFVKKMNGILIRGTIRNYPESKNIRKELTAKQFFYAAFMAKWFSLQQVITLIPEIVDGKFSSIWKVPSAAAVTAVTIPGSLSKKLLKTLLDEVGLGDNKAVASLIGAGDLVVEIVAEADRVLSKSVDEIGDEIEVVARKIGNTTGLDKPVRELREEIELLVKHPKKAIGKAAQKVIDAVLPWRWRKIF